MIPANFEHTPNSAKRDSVLLSSEADVPQNGMETCASIRVRLLSVHAVFKEYYF